LITSYLVKCTNYTVLIMHSSPAYRHSLHPSLLGPNILLSTLNLCSSLSVRQQVSHPYKTVGKVIVLEGKGKGDVIPVLFFN
jgi:hypothetical protein